MTEIQRLPEDHPAMRVVTMPRDTNPFGDIFGGWVMALMDQAGGTVAVKRARGRVATVGVDRFSFKRPVQVGDLISIYAWEERIGTTSLTMRVQAWAERRDGSGVIKVTEGLFTYCAIDDNRNKRPVPPAE